MQKFPNILHVTGSMRGIALASGIDVGWDPDGPWRALLDAGSVQYSLKPVLIVIIVVVTTSRRRIGRQ